MEYTKTTKTVLLVDDEFDICDFLCEYLHEKHIATQYATDIEDALALAKSKKIDLVFLDNNLLSNVKGVEFIPEFKVINPDCKVFMLTANSKPHVRERAKLLGADGFICKPFDFETFDLAIESI